MLAHTRPSTGPRREGAGERPRAEPADADRRIYTYSVPSSCMPSRGGRLFTLLAREQAAQSTARPRAAPRTALAALSRSARLHSVMGELCGDRTACRTSSARTASTSPRAPPAPSCSSQTWPAQTRPTLDGAAPHACSREQVPVFRKANSILFSPACASKRYAGRTPNSAKPTFTGELRAGVAHRPAVTTRRSRDASRQQATSTKRKASPSPGCSSTST